MRRRTLLMIFVMALLGNGACTDVYNQIPTSPTSPTSPSPTPTPPRVDRIEYHVVGSQISTFTPVTIRHSDSINGVTLYTGGLPYVAATTSTDESIFLFVQASGFGNLSTSTLQVSIFVNGRLFREAFVQGFTLETQASGVYRR